MFKKEIDEKFNKSKTIIMERIGITQSATHILILKGEKFPIYHKERRLYSFVDWKDSRDKLIRIMLEKIRNDFGKETAFISFKMANPMRKTRLGNFFIDLEADVKINGKSLGTLQELGMKNIFIDSFETLDIEELEIRKERETKFSKEQYNEELNNRMTDFLNNSDTNLKNLNTLKDYLKKQVVESMRKEGWDITSDNRLVARRKRLGLM